MTMCSFTVLPDSAALVLLCSKPRMRSESLTGLQMDGKLQRLISIFEDLCSEGKIPTASLHSQILSLLGDARMIFNRAGDRRKKEPFIKNLKKLNKKIDQLLAKLPR